MLRQSGLVQFQFRCNTQLGQFHLNNRGTYQILFYIHKCVEFRNNEYDIQICIDNLNKLKSTPMNHP